MDFRFKDFVLTQTCCACGAYPTEGDHIPTRGAAGALNHDLINPLCRRCHNERHQIGVESFQNKYNINLEGNIDKMWKEYCKRIRGGGN